MGERTRTQAVELSNEFKRKAKNAFTNPSQPSAYSSKRRLADAVKDKSGHKSAKWLQSQDAYTLHAPFTRRFHRRPTIVSGPGVQLQADLMDVSSHSHHNDNVKFLLTVVDVFSRLAWVEPLQSKRGEEVRNKLKRVIDNNNYRYLQTDKGTEFRNTHVQRLLKEKGMDWFSSENEVIKASMVERFNRTLRRKIHGFLTFSRQGRFIDKLGDMVSAYNHTKHSSTGFAPVEVNRANAEEVFVRLYEKGKCRERSALFDKGNHVRITKARGVFDRGYTPNWTREIFVVDRVLRWNHPVVYTLVDLAGEPVLGTFYHQELQRVEKPTVFNIERVIRWRGRGPQREALVKWEGYPESMNSWVPESDFE